jgi:hypothetical protein
MAMPETTMHKNDSSPFWQDYIGFSRQVLHMQAIAETIGKEVFPHEHLGFRILTPDAAHVVTPYLWFMNVQESSVSYGILGYLDKYSIAGQDHSIL